MVVRGEEAGDDDSTCFQAIPVESKNIGVCAPKRILPVGTANFACPADGGPGHDDSCSISIRMGLSSVTNDIRDEGDEYLTADTSCMSGRRLATFLAL